MKDYEDLSLQGVSTYGSTLRMGKLVLVVGMETWVTYTSNANQLHKHELRDECKYKATLIILLDILMLDVG